VSAPCHNNSLRTLIVSVYQIKERQPLGYLELAAAVQGQTL